MTKSPESALVFNHVSDDYGDTVDPELAGRVRAGVAAYHETTTTARVRSRTQLLDLVCGLDLASHGLVDVTAWPGPLPTAAAVGVLAAVSTVPATSTDAAS